jgi:hypothetical protein
MPDVIERAIVDSTDSAATVGGNCRFTDLLAKSQIGESR